MLPISDLPRRVINGRSPVRSTKLTQRWIMNYRAQHSLSCRNGGAINIGCDWVIFPLNILQWYLAIVCCSPNSSPKLPISRYCTTFWMNHTCLKGYGYLKNPYDESNESKMYCAYKRHRHRIIAIIISAYLAPITLFLSQENVNTVIEMFV